MRPGRAPSAARATVITVALCLALAVSACGGGTRTASRFAAQLDNAASEAQIARNAQNVDSMMAELGLASQVPPAPPPRSRALNLLGQAVCGGSEVAGLVPDGVDIVGIAEVDPGSGTVVGVMAVPDDANLGELDSNFTYLWFDGEAINNSAKAVSLLCED